MALQTLLDRHATYRADATALVFGDERYSWADLQRHVDALINGLARNGIGKGDHVAILLENSVAVILLYWAAAKGGVVVVPLSPLLRGSGLVTLINDSDAVAVVSQRDMVPNLEDIRDQLIAVDDNQFFLIDGPEPGYRRFDDLLVEPQLPVEPTLVSDDDIYNIIYSSGTTGLPKGIVHTHGVRQAYCTGFATSFRIAQDSVIVHSGSLVFNGAFLTLMPWFLTGCVFVLMPRFHPRSMVDIMVTESVTHAMLVPTQIVQLLSDDRFILDDLPATQMLCSVGAPLLLDSKQHLIERFPDRCYELYGLTEGFMTILDRSDFGAKAGSVGVPPPLFEMRILNDDGDDVEVGEVGEIVGRGPVMMPGYHKRPDLTAEAIRDGWLHSGDLGYIDNDGYLHLVDRKKDLIISGGVNVYPKDIEEVAITHPAVRDVAVFGIPHPTWGEQAVAAVTLIHEVDPSDVQQWINDRVEARYQKVGAVIVLDEFPVSVAGKTLRRDIKSTYLEELE